MSSREEPVGVVIVDDHRMFAESLARLLADEEGITVVGVAATAPRSVGTSRTFAATGPADRLPHARR